MKLFLRLGQEPFLCAVAVVASRMDAVRSIAITAIFCVLVIAQIKRATPDSKAEDQSVENFRA
jgi:hypothetical protein